MVLSIFIVASRLWEQKQKLFEETESARLSRVEKEIYSAGPASRFGCLFVIFLALIVAVFGGDGLFAGPACGVVVFGFGGVVIVVKAEFGIRRLLRESELKGRTFDVPKPVFAPRREEYRPPPRREKRHESHTSSTNEVTVTSMRQAYEILGLQPGRKTLTEVRKAFRSRMSEYHPDKVAHLGVALRELTSRKAVEINLAMEFIDARLKGPNSV
jgi:DnaJ-like protein